MHVITRRNAVIGWIVTRIARKRLERRLNAVAGNARRGRRLALGAIFAAGAAAAGALVARRAAGSPAA